VEAKGKGKMQTYWANPKKAVSGSVVSSTNTNEESDDLTAENADHIRRLVDWNADISVSIFDWSLLSAMRRRVPNKMSSGMENVQSCRYARHDWSAKKATTDRSAWQYLGRSKEIIEPEFDAVARKLESLPAIELSRMFGTASRA
jgi:hypothetical protein